jgi:hypothetical protein
MSLVTAVAVATVFALFGFPFQYYWCWFSFSRLGATLGTLLYLVLAGGGGGLLGWGGAQVGHVMLTTSVAFNGVLYGLAGSLALRADFRNPPKRSARSAPRPAPAAADSLTDARSALSASIKWTADLLDRVAEQKAKAWLLSMSDQELSAEALGIQAEIAQDRTINDRAKKELLGQLVPNMEKLTKPAENNEGRAQLVAFCSTYYRENHRVRTPTPPGMGDHALQT